jgi:hypothetical protein
MNALLTSCNAVAVVRELEEGMKSSGTLEHCYQLPSSRKSLSA